MSSANCGWFFYKKPFLSKDKKKIEDEIKKANRELLDTKLYDYPFQTENFQTIKLKTIYPGLVIGSGYTHSLKDQSDNFDFGFYFDHTTGMPVIPGSSVKGTLRSMFGIGQTNHHDRYQDEKQQLIQELLKELLGKDEKDEDEDIDVKKLALEIFEGKKDKFFDAYISKADSNGMIFADDYITPHEDPLKNPVPNRMLKIRGGVEFTFVFELHGGIITADEKIELFKKLLMFSGIGAKTNVGYGQFELV